MRERGLVWVKESVRKNLEEESSTKDTTPNLYHRVPHIRVSTSNPPRIERERGYLALTRSITRTFSVVVVVVVVVSSR